MKEIISEKNNSCVLNNETFEFIIPIITNTDYDLSKFDFSFVDIQLFDIESIDFKEFITQNKYKWLERYYQSFIQIFKEEKYIKKKRYAIVKKKIDTSFDYKNILNVFSLLIIVFPSNLKIERLYNFKSRDNQISLSINCSDARGERKLFLHSTDNYLKEINEFFFIVFNGLNSKSFTEITIDNYLNSFYITNPKLKFVSLCISLESIIGGNYELRYRIARSLAILCGKDKSCSELIFKNVQKIYDLRSAIVHGESLKQNYINECRNLNIFNNYLQYLVSRMIIELLIHDIDKSELGCIITSLGFGQRQEISNNWKYYSLNIKNTLIENQELKKFW